MLLYLISIVSLATSLYIFNKSHQRRKLLPPGPRGLPVLGNILQIPKEYEWRAYREWCRQFNTDILYLEMIGTPIIILNSRSVARELLEKRSSIYSDRPRYTMLNELLSFDWEFSFISYGKAWKERRKLFTQELQQPKSLQYRPRILKSTHKLLRRLMDKPDDFMWHFRHMAGDITLSISYGIDVLPEHDPFVELAEAALKVEARAATFGYYLVDILPILRYFPSWLPGMKFKRQAREWRKLSEAMINEPFEFAKRETAAGTGKQSIASAVLEKLDGNDKEDRERILRDALGAVYNAGADTTVSALGTFILAMVQNPEIQKKGQEAVDNAIGANRLPGFEDMASIPYVDAILKEVLRWNPVTPLAIPHRLSIDDVYEGYHLPAGAVVIGNAWAMLQDELTYGKDTNLFNPERFMKGTELDPNIPHPDAAFGFGRRSCPGQDIAWSSMWIAIASILATFDISKAVSKTGNDIKASGEYTSGLVCYPKPFQCSIRPRLGTINLDLLLNEEL